MEWREPHFQVVREDSVDSSRAAGRPVGVLVALVIVRNVEPIIDATGYDPRVARVERRTPRAGGGTFAVARESGRDLDPWLVPDEWRGDQLPQTLNATSQGHDVPPPLDPTRRAAWFVGPHC
jgi:hypothetical protein